MQARRRRLDASPTGESGDDQEGVDGVAEVSETQRDHRRRPDKQRQQTQQRPSFEILYICCRLWPPAVDPHAVAAAAFHARDERTIPGNLTTIETFRSFVQLR